MIPTTCTVASIQGAATGRHLVSQEQAPAVERGQRQQVEQAEVTLSSTPA
jgi:hypothetical protein